MTKIDSEALLHGPYTTDQFGAYIYGVNDKIGGLNTVLDIRGWGYLTGNGHGALGLEVSAGMAEQKRFAQFVVDALNAAESRTSPVGGWEPIETAPRDGTLILVCRAGDKDWPLRCRRWQDSHWRGWDAEDATHWMPLPAPPAQPGGEG
jgi:hypothetical protein